MAGTTQSHILKFGVFEADLEAGELRKSGMRLKLAAQPFQVLQVLLEHPQQIVTREELKRHIWPQDTFVDYDLALRKAIARLREVLGESAESPRFIETIPRRGYRFIAPLNTIGHAPAAEELPTRNASPHPIRSGRPMPIGIVAGIGASFALLLGLGIVSTKLNRQESMTSAAPQIRSVAVLPLRNLSNDPTQEYFSEGMTDALITELAQNSSLKVISRTSSMQYRETRKALPKIARELNVDGIIEGTVQRSGDRVRITAQLVYGPSDKHLWANSYERDLRDAFALERDVAQEIAKNIQAQLKMPKQPYSVKAKALDAYLRGSYYLNRFSEEDIRKAQQYFQQAIDTDPNFAPAYVGMALAHYGRFQGSTEDEAMAERAARRALELDPTLSDAWVTLGKIKLNSWDWVGMEQDYRKAIELNPNNANAHEEFGALLDAMGRLDEGLRECQVAQELDPNHEHLSWALSDRREFDRSIDIKLIMLRNDPDNAVLHHNLYLDYQAKGMYKEAIQHAGRSAALAGFPQVAVDLDKAFAISGYRGAMREYAKQLAHLHATKEIFLPVNLAGVYAILGDKDRAFYWLEQAYRHSRGSGLFLWQIKLYPALDPLHSDPRFKDLVHRIGLPP
jgi:TolB-like protein/DNA-binding winged helix-turn-helix (wHTH) protein/Tfp pilus assembly protein PilF